jgi:hypothetical protein
MKKLFFLLPVLFFLKLSAQQPYYDFKEFKKKNDGSYLFQLDRKTSKDSLMDFFKNVDMLSKGQPMGRLLYTLQNGTMAYALPQDNMICLVPDLSQFNMPIVGKGIKISGMPPGSIPPNNILPK